MTFANIIPGIFGAIFLAAISLQAVKPVPAMAADECEVAAKQAQEIDARNLSITAKIKSKQAMLTSALDNGEDNIAIVLAGDIKVYMISYLGLIIEQRSTIKTFLENGISNRCHMDKPTLEKIFHESFALEEEYKSMISEITKSLNTVNNTKSAGTSL